jgi:hypothetical protein
MKLKLDDAGHVVVKDGNPVYVHDDGKEIPFDAAGTVATISRLNGEAKGHREAKERAETALKAFEGIEDADAARKALETVKNLDTKKLIDAGEVEKVKAEAKLAFDEQVKAIEEKYKPVVKERNELKAEIVAEKVGNAFSRSKYIADSLAVPVDMVQATFGRNFKLEDGNVIGYGKDGKQIFSRVKPGEVADFDEALEILVDAYPFKDNILKGSGASGGGAGGGANGKGNVYTRAQFDQISLTDPGQASKIMAAVRAGEAKVVDAA